MSRATRQVGRRRRLGRAIAEMHYQLRTEGDTPLRTGIAVWLGTLLGCFPLWGLHLPLCVGLARLLRVSRIKVYLAAHVNNPLTAVPLLYVQVATGSRILDGRWELPSLLHPMGLFDLGRDLVVGSAVVGMALGVVFGLVAFGVSVRARRTSTLRTALKERTSSRYMDAGVLTWERVRGKLRHDPVYFGVLRAGLLRGERGRLLDLGCGRGVLLALLQSAAELHREGAWSEEWPAPPLELEPGGVEIRGRRVRVARRALASRSAVTRADVREFDPPRCRVVVMFDVLHQIEPESQERLLGRVARSLEPGGLVLLRETDMAPGLRFRLTCWTARLAAATRGEWRRPMHYRSRPEWTSLLERSGLEVHAVPSASGGLFARMLLQGRKAPAAAERSPG